MFFGVRFMCRFSTCGKLGFPHVENWKTHCKPNEMHDFSCFSKWKSGKLVVNLMKCVSFMLFCVETYKNHCKPSEIIDLLCETTITLTKSLICHTGNIEHAS